MDSANQGGCEGSGFSRRAFMGAGGCASVAVAAACGLSGSSSAQGGQTQAQAAPGGQAAAVLPKRPLGETGLDVTILNLGTWRNPGLDRLVRFAYSSGVRMYDTARVYGSEPGLKRWFQAMPEVRKEIVLVTKDHAKEPGQLEGLLDQRLETLGVEQVDIFFLHALGDDDPRAGVEWPKSAELGRVFERIKQSGKARFLGFSTHHRERAAFLQSAAQGGFIDVIMLQYTPWLDRDSPLNKALDACHAKGIGLISMKQIAGQYSWTDNAGIDVLKEVQKRVPTLKERGLSPYQGLLQAIWSDERIASCCVSMRNTDQIRENAHAARTYQPMKQADIRALKDASLAFGPTLCADCDGRCGRAAGTTAALGELTRFLTYHDHHGYRVEARSLYAKLSPAEREWSGADLHAATAACPSRLDFARLLPLVDERLG